MLSEEASEAANKDLKKWQVSHSRQIDPIKRSLDSFNRMMDRSDPIVLSKFDTKKYAKCYESFPKQVLDLCKTPDEILSLHIVRS